MRRAASITVLGILVGLAMTMVSCERLKRRIVQTLVDPSGRWVAVVDEVEYANGLLTSVADRVVVIQSASKDAEGTQVFCEDAMPYSEKPTIAWSKGRLVIGVSPKANVLAREARAFGFEVEFRSR